MSLNVSRARPLLQNADFSKLFVEELGWEPSHQKLTLRVSERNFVFTAIAEKRGFTVWLCESPDGQLPDHTTRLKLDRALTQTSFEHLVVFITGDLVRQSWMWVRREPGKPLTPRTHEFTRGQPGESLLQKLQILYVSLEEEEQGELSTIAMAGRARAAFDIERVTKAFYRDFDTHRVAFLKFIEGIEEVADREWYASVMLNRLMFVYFIQRKGFLDADPNYLRNRLKCCRQEKGKDKFYTFYRYFLLRLFHEGFGKRRKDRTPDLEKLLGNIPYLNGGLFDVHDIEKPERYGKDIQIPDKAFEGVFDYFDKYQWHLDERPLRKDDEINPDVLGYIFEKYINQKQMGAYYTKEDITEYISKNTVLPFLLEDSRAKCKVAFENSNGPTVWDLLRENPDRYIYPSIRHGTGKKLPPEIAAGIDTIKPKLIERRKAWDEPAPVEYALPTEIWREVVARRERYEEVREKLATGKIREVNDLITLNLDIRQFAQDVVTNSEGPELLRAVWHAIEKVTVLDPTCGSGAFLFAALNILEPLYESCLDRMEAFVADDDRMRPKSPEESIRELIASGESHFLEFKATARWNVKECKADKAMEQVIIKTVAAFLNSKGGDLIIGVKDDGSIFGIEMDLQLFSVDKRNRDFYQNWLMTQLLGAYGNQYSANLRVSFARLGVNDVCRVTVLPAPTAVYVKENNQDVLYVRTGNSTRSLTISEAVAYHQQRFSLFSQPLVGAEILESRNLKKYADFRKVLDTVVAHPNRRYFILKSIILNNLFGVDIMEEAVEICKLRLFLKLASQVEPDIARDNLGIEPLPDIDFNIRAGNSLVGYSTAEEVRRSMKEGGGGQMKLMDEAELEGFARFNMHCAEVEDSFTKFRRLQTESDGSVPAADKQELQKRLKALEDELNRYLAVEYGVKLSNKSAYTKWVKFHQPFHWFIHFYGIVNAGGFDAIIGNPPYVVNTSEKVRYGIQERLFTTYPSKNLYSFVFERSLQLSDPNAGVGMIVQLSALSAEKMSSLQDLLLHRGLLVASAFPRRPESIFDGVEMPVAIMISRPSIPVLHTTRVNRFYTEERPSALAAMGFAQHDFRLHGHRIAKIGSQIGVDIYRKIESQKGVLGSLTSAASKHVLYYQEACRYWVKACVGLPFFRRNGERMAPPHGRILHFRDAGSCAFAGCLVNSTLFYWFYSAFSDCEHINDALIRDFRIPFESNQSDWIALESQLAKSQKRYARRKTIFTKQGHKIEYDEMDAPQSKSILDKIDTVLAGHYGFTAEELDFILNYDIKYRLGRSTETDEE